MEDKKVKTRLKIVLDSNEKTLVCEGQQKPESKRMHQSEKELEEELIRTLKDQGYEYLERMDDDGLKRNLRTQLEKLARKRIKDFRFSDNEWNRFFSENFEGIDNEGVENRTKTIQGIGYKKLLKRDDGEELNIDLIDKEIPQNNYLQVINQFRDKESQNRYDVTILVNGLPLVHIEIKKRGISIEDAFYQIEGYKKNSFRKLFEFIQIFVISNGTFTRYFSNTTKYEKKNSFLFTTSWARPDNSPVEDLIDFAKDFLERHTILEILTKYCVLDCKSDLKILRPYQINGVKKILEKINNSINDNTSGRDAGGYIWHTTGSGKTLTSFKASQLAHKIKEIKKVLFVVDRKDLDSQTYREYKNFSGEFGEQTIDSTENTKALLGMINDDKKRIIITTIQKLRRLLKDKQIQIKDEILKKQRMVIIMDECHRSQTQDMHELIEKFEKRNLFGFTGTPLFKEVKKDSEQKAQNLTQRVFGKELHAYKIINAIKDEKVLKFQVIHFKEKHSDEDKINYAHPSRIERIVEHIIGDFFIKTNPSTTGITDDEFRKTTKFNSIFATEKISSAISYYKEFEKQLKNVEKNLKVAIIYSAFSDTDQEKQSAKDYEDLSEDQKDFLDKAIEKYEQQFNCKINGFNDYRNDVSERVKNREIDILIVVNMFLTGFDAKKLNTLWVDKHLEGHNLIQAFSRTNRILNKGKPHGNIICFRDLKDEIDRAVARYATGVDGSSFFVEDFETRMKEFSAIENYLLTEFPIEKEIIGDSREELFVKNYRSFMKLNASLSDDDRFKKQRKMSPLQIQDYKSKYLKIFRNFQVQIQNDIASEKNTSFVEDRSFDLEYLGTDDVDIDYIMEQISKYSRKKGDRDFIIRLVRGDLRLIEEEDIVLGFLDAIDSGQDISYKEYKKKMLDNRFKKMVNDHNLRQEGTQKFLENAIKKQNIRFIGKAREKIMPEISPEEYDEQKEIWETVKIELLKIFNLLKDF